jgi:hypothetical protein
MLSTNTRKNLRYRTICGTLVTLILSLSIGSAAAQGTMPVIAAAGVPLYPRLVRQSHIEGEVRLELSTDGERVSDVYVVSGQAMLAQAAKENVGTWRFEQHSPTKFLATFRYKLLPVPEELRCAAASHNSAVMLRLPADVEVSADEMWVCDPATAAH